MKNAAIAHTARVALAWSAISRAARLSVFGFIGWFWFLSGDDSAWTAVPLAAALGLAAVVGITWFVSHALAARRRRAAWDRYAEQEQAKRTHSRRKFHARPQSQAGGTAGGAAV